MILHPAVLALLIASVLISAMVLFASFHASHILKHWDRESGSELQLQLERNTYLISTLLAYALLFQLLSLALLVYVADTLHVQIAGAMCAVGTFNANSLGYPALALKIGNFLFAGLWLILNFADARGYDYPLIRAKYSLLLVLALPIYLESLLVWRFFFGLKGDVITSCCGSLFSTGQGTVSSELAGLPPLPTAGAFYLGAFLTLALWLWFLRGRGRGYALAIVAGLTFLAGVAATISYFAPTFYELPHHHCPFCLLQAEYHHLGYLLYATLFGGAVAGMGCGVLAPFHGIPSLSATLPWLQRRLALLCLLCYGLFTLIVTLRVLTSDFRLFS
ncbi:MAG: hypothetical protein IH614_01085 [Desulfuromonadales bacterium]|nr:hypothetical protein [Desulfuromonadales bacterium]